MVLFSIVVVVGVFGAIFSVVVVDNIFVVAVVVVDVAFLWSFVLICRYR